MASEVVVVMGAVTNVCYEPRSVASIGLWMRDNPLNHALPLLLLQLISISLATLLIDICIRPLRQSTIVSKICSGIIFGPSLLGHSEAFASGLFPERGKIVIETAASFGLMFFFFQMGVKTDPGMMLRPGWKAVVIGVSVSLLTLGLTAPLSLLLKSYVPMDKSLASSLPLIAATQCLSAFPNIIFLITELKILNTDIGRLTITTSLFCDVIGISLSAISFIIMDKDNSSLMRSALAFVSIIALLAIIAFVFRPILMWILARTKEETVVGELFIIAIFCIVLLAGLASEVLGQHFMLGPLILGLAVPEGPPLGSALVAKLDLLITGLLYPTFLTVSGLKTNFFQVNFQSTWIVTIVVIFATLVKIGVVLLIAHHTKMPSREALVLGLLLNTRGICELLLYNLWKDSQILGDQEFTLAVVGVVAVTAIITPIIRALYDPSRLQFPTRRRTIQQAKDGAELRVLVCIHNQDNISTVVNLLEASSATEESPIAVTALLLIELVGRAAPMIVAHQPSETLEANASTSSSSQLINALHQYSVHNEGRVTVQSFSAISHMEMVHEDICRVAFEQNTNLVIIPFHKHWAIDGEIGSVDRSIQEMNTKVIEKAPCSVGILIDRGILKGSVSILNNQTTYHVAVLYIGGPDDVESLTYSARMANHNNVTLTVIRFLLFGCDNARERKLDNDLINEVCRANRGNEDFSYQEQVVRDGVGLASSIRELEECFDLILVGRQHQASTLLQGLGAWTECPELGVIGDFLASSDFSSTASILVVQHQRVPGGRLMNQAMKPIATDRDIPLQSIQSHAEAETTARDRGATWAISMDRV